MVFTMQKMSQARTAHVYGKPLHVSSSTAPTVFVIKPNLNRLASVPWWNTVHSVSLDLVTLKCPQSTLQTTCEDCGFWSSLTSVLMKWCVFNEQIKGAMLPMRPIFWWGKLLNVAVLLVTQIQSQLSLFPIKGNIIWYILWVTGEHLEPLTRP